MLTIDDIIYIIYRPKISFIKVKYVTALNGPKYTGLPQLMHIYFRATISFNGVFAFVDKFHFSIFQ